MSIGYASCLGFSRSLSGVRRGSMEAKLSGGAAYMAMTIKKESDANGFGDETNSFSVPMGYFSVIGGDSTVTYLKSTGFGSCIGLVLYSAEKTALAHFQSANWAKEGVDKTAEAFGKAGVLDYAKFEGFLFLGSNVNEKPLDQQTQKSQENTKAGLVKVRQKMWELGVQFHHVAPETGFKSVAVSLASGEVRLFDETPKVNKTPNLNLFPAVGSALVQVQPK
jgi:hypothetical protein